MSQPPIDTPTLVQCSVTFTCLLFQFLSHPDDRQGSVIFFDLLGLYLICYPEWLGFLLNVSVLIVSIYTTYSKINRAHQFGVTTNVYMRQFLYTFLTQVTGCVMSFVTVTFVAALLDAMGNFGRLNSVVILS